MTKAHRIGMDREHDGDRLGRLSGRLDKGRGRRENDVHLHADQFGDQFRQLINLPRPSEL